MNENKIPCSPHGWTLDTLEKFLSARLNELSSFEAEREQRNLERFESARLSVEKAINQAERAIDKVEKANDQKFDRVNEFRAAMADQNTEFQKMLTDQGTKFLTREEYKLAHQSLIDKIDSLTIRTAAQESLRKGQGEGIGMVWALAIGVAVVLSSASAVTDVVLTLTRKG